MASSARINTRALAQVHDKFPVKHLAPTILLPKFIVWSEKRGLKNACVPSNGHEATYHAINGHGLETTFQSQKKG